MEIPSEVLVAEANLRLRVVHAEHQAVFKEAFHSTWERLPKYGRDRLTDYWFLDGANLYLTKRWDGSDQLLGQCRELGSAILINSSHLGWMPRDILEIVIAHELVHAFFYASNDPYHCSNAFPEPIARKLAEALTHEMTSIWGFPSAKLREFCLREDERLSGRKA